MFIQQLCIFPLYYVVCGRGFDRLSYGVLWPVITANEVAGVYCSDIIPMFGFGPRAMRRCRANGTWDRVDMSQCSVTPTQRHVTIMYSTYAMYSNDTTVILEIEQVC